MLTMMKYQQKQLYKKSEYCHLIGEEKTLWNQFTFTNLSKNSGILANLTAHDTVSFFKEFIN